MLPAVTADQAHDAGFPDGQHAPPVVLLFVDPTPGVKGPGYLGGVHEGGRLERRLTGHPGKPTLKGNRVLRPRPALRSKGMSRPREAAPSGSSTERRSACLG